MKYEDDSNLKKQYLEAFELLLTRLNINGIKAI